MSFFRKTDLRVGVSPNHLTIVSYVTTIGRRLDVCSTVPVTGDIGETVRSVAAGRTISIVLSNHFVRYAVLPWSDALRSEADWFSYAKHCFDSTYGRVSAEWEIRLSHDQTKAARVACAIDRNIVDPIRSIPGLLSIQPYFAAAVNARRRVLLERSGWLVLHEPGRLTIALYLDGSWLLIRRRQVRGEWPDGLAAILDAEAIGLETVPDVVAVCSEHDVPARMSHYRISDVTLLPSMQGAPRSAAIALA